MGRLAAGLTFEAGVAEAGVGRDALALQRALVDVDARGRVARVALPTRVTRTLFERRTVAVAWKKKTDELHRVWHWQ